MLISVMGFGSVWTRRSARERDDQDRHDRQIIVYYNTTGVLIGDRFRNRPRAYGVARFNACSGFRPDLMHKMLHKVFECEPPCIWNGHNKVLFKNILERPAKPDAYLVTMTHEQSGGIDKDPNGAWLHNSAQLISFSEGPDQQEVMVVMPAFSWLRGRLGTFFLEPVARKPWEARLILSAAV
jgi:hypothetical protein